MSSNSWSILWNQLIDVCAGALYKWISVSQSEYLVFLKDISPEQTKDEPKVRNESMKTLSDIHQSLLNGIE